MENLRTITNYAKLCGITKGAIYQRITLGQIIPTLIDGQRFVDIKMYPPCKKKGGRKCN